MGTRTKPGFDFILSERKAFDETKAGVKGLVEAGVKKLPSIFHRQLDKFEKTSNVGNTCHVIPVIDLEDIHEDPSKSQEHVCRHIYRSMETMGFFQVVNHGIPVRVLEEMKNGVKRFHDQDTEIKRESYTQDQLRSFAYYINFDLRSSPALSWRDTFLCYLYPDAPTPEEIPEVCSYVFYQLYGSPAYVFEFKILKM